MALKLPALWPDNPRKWFLYCEGKFRIHKITAQQTMFDHSIHAMTADQSDVVMDLMVRGPSHDYYDDLKRVYIERRTPTTAERMQRLQLTHRYCRSFAGITRLLMSIDDCGSIHKVAGSHTTERHCCTHVCSCVLVSLGFAIWCAIISVR